MFFTYTIKDKTNGKYYYGSRTAKNCKETDILTKYFSSSKILKEQIALKGIENFEAKTRKRFKNKMDCFEHEKNFLNRVNASTNDLFYNIDQNLDPSLAIQNQIETILIKNIRKNQYIRWPKYKEIPYGFIKEGPSNGKESVTKNTKWYYNKNTLESKMFKTPPNDDHWIPGRGPTYVSGGAALKNKNSHWYTNGVDSIMISKNDKIPEGFYRGKTHKTKPSGKRHRKYIWVTVDNKSFQIPEENFDPGVHTRGAKALKRKTGKDSPSARKIQFKNKEYDTIREAVKKTGVSPYLIKKHQSFQYLDG